MKNMIFLQILIGCWHTCHHHPHVSISSFYHYGTLFPQNSRIIRLTVRLFLSPLWLEWHLFWNIQNQGTFFWSFVACFRYEFSAAMVFTHFRCIFLSFIFDNQSVRGHYYFEAAYRIVKLKAHFP